MGYSKPSSGLTLKPDKQPGFRPWLPYQQNAPCCEPVPHIQANGLGVTYQGSPALQNVTLNINRGCLTAIVGPSGCGKTSFLMCVNRLTDLIPSCQVSGALRINEMDVLASTTQVLNLRRMVGMIFQKPTVFPFSIRKNLELPLREYGITDHSTLSKRIETVFTQVGLWNEVKDRLNHPAQALSGGQQQRLCLARALVLSPKILLLDEPCSALDPLSSGVVEDLIVSLRGQYTILIVTHNLAQARRIADDVAFFWPLNGVGHLIEHGTAQDIFESPKDQLTAAYIAGTRG